MKKKIFPALFAALAFVLSYIGCCYTPWLRIKLSAAPMTYFVESIKHMVLVKSLISAAIAALTAVIAYILIKSSDTETT